MILLQAQRAVSHEKPWHDPTFVLDLVPCIEIWAIAELDVVCERGGGALFDTQNHLLDNLEGLQNIQVGSVGAAPTRDVHIIIE
jgi:hypothetical protein